MKIERKSPIRITLLLSFAILLSLFSPHPANAQQKTDATQPTPAATPAASPSCLSEVCASTQCSATTT
jgi:hypothetical protein